MYLASPNIAPTVARARARHAVLSRHYGPDHPATGAAELDLREAALAEAIRNAVDAMPPFTAAQRDRLATLLRGVTR